MKRKAPLHFINSDSRQRADHARIGFSLGHHSEVYGDLSELAAHPPREGLIIARDIAEEGGVPVTLNRLGRLGIWLPLIAVEENPRPARIVKAIKAGALDYLTLPLDPDRFSRCLARIEKEAEQFGRAQRRMMEARGKIETLSRREREVLEWLAEGSSNKAIARELEISPRTVEIHRANMMNKLDARHPADAVRLKIEARLEPSMQVAEVV